MSDGARRIRLIVARCIEIPDDALTPGARLVEDLGADRLDIVQIMADLEREFAIRIEEHEAAAAGTVEDITALVEERTAGSETSCPPQRALHEP